MNLKCLCNWGLTLQVLLVSPSPYRRHVALPLFPSAHQCIMIDGLSHTFCSVRSTSGNLLVFPWWRMLARNQPLSVDRGPPVLTATYSKFSIYHSLQQMVLYRATVYFSGRKREREEKEISEKEREEWSVRGGKEEKRLIKRGGLSLYLGHK